MASLPFSSALLSPALGAFPAHLRERLWHGDALVSAVASIASGFQILDEQLPGGGWPTRGLTELLLSSPGIGELRLVAASLSSVCRAGRSIMVMTPGPLGEAVLYPDGWSQLGIDPSQLLIVHTENLTDRLWAIEQALRSAACGALMAWLPAVRQDALRRLQLAAAGSDGLSFLFRPSTLVHEATPAPLRLLLERDVIQPERSLAVQILKRRGPVLGHALQIALAEPRPLRIHSTERFPSTPAVSSQVRHAVDRPPLPDTVARLHPAPAA
jgi:protein ImuA